MRGIRITILRNGRILLKIVLHYVKEKCKMLKHIKLVKPCLFLHFFAQK